MIVYYALLVVIAFERLAELVVSQRHAAELRMHVHCAERRAVYGLATLRDAGRG